MEEAIYFRVPSAIAVDPTLQPRKLPTVVVRGTRNKCAVGLIIFLMGIFLSGFGLSAQHWKLALAGLPFVGLGAWMAWGAIMRRRTAQMGRAISAKMYLMDVPQSMGPVEMRFIWSEQPVPSGARQAVIQAGISIGTLRAVYEIDGQERQVCVHLEPGELPVPVRWNAGIGTGVLISENARNRAVPWTDSASSEVLVANPAR